MIFSFVLPEVVWHIVAAPFLSRHHVQFDSILLIILLFGVFVDLVMDYLVLQDFFLIHEVVKLRQGLVVVGVALFYFLDCVLCQLGGFDLLNCLQCGLGFLQIFLLIWVFVSSFDLFFLMDPILFCLFNIMLSQILLLIEPVLCRLSHSLVHILQKPEEKAKVDACAEPPG